MKRVIEQANIFFTVCVDACYKLKILTNEGVNQWNQKFILDIVVKIFKRDNVN